MSEDLSRRQVELILRRTAELERKSGGTDDTALTPAELEKVASELGLSGPALQRAIAESRAGLLADEAPQGLVDRVFGPTTVVAARHVPGVPGDVRKIVDRFLEAQGFQVKRHHGERTVWERAPGIWSSVRRALQGGAVSLPRDVELDVQVSLVPGGAYPTFVSLRADASRVRGRHVGGATAALVGGAAVATVGAFLLPIPIELATWAGGALAAGGGVLGARASYRGDRTHLTDALERFLDFLEHDPTKATAGSSDPLSRLADLARGWFG